MGGIISYLMELDRSALLMLSMYIGNGHVTHICKSLILMFMRLFVMIEFMPSSNREKNDIIMTNILHKHKISSLTTTCDNKKYPTDLVFGYGWIAYVLARSAAYKDEYKFDIYLIGKEMYINELLEYQSQDDEDKADANKYNTIYDDETEYDGDVFSQFDIEKAIHAGIVLESSTMQLACIRRKNSCIDTPLKIMSIIFKFNQYQYQMKIINKICKHAENSYDNGFGFNTSVLLWGVPGTGKSVLAKILTDKLGGILCDIYCPMEAGITLEMLYNMVSPTKKRPLIILINELYELIETVHNNPISSFYKNMRPEISDKTTCNSWFDRINEYDNIITIFTSNHGKEDFNALDESYIRQGRIDHFFKFTDKYITTNYLKDRYTAKVKLDSDEESDDSKKDN